MRLRHALAALAVLLPMPDAGAQTFRTEKHEVRAVAVAKGLAHPWGLAFLPDGRMLVTERPGRMRIVSPDGRISRPVEGVPEVYARGQGGLLDVTLHPDFARNRLVYFTYAEPGPGGGGTAAAFARLSDDGARLENLKVIFRMEPKTEGGLHFGSRLVFARDGRVFITIGERGQMDLAQDISVNRGQVIRLEADGRVPADNPFVNRHGARPEIWSYGHRNPQGAAIHPETGKLWTVEHGPAGGDEINIPLAGRNYGWPVIGIGKHYDGRPIGVGTHKEGMEQPVYNWDPQIAPSGMAFYTGDKFPAWRGNLLVALLMTQALVRLELSGERVVREERMLRGVGQRLRHVRQGPDGFVYLLTDESDGQILRLEPAR
ncbi:MAG: PQQ-dependent sugar dehydrogenase [Candidatus Odyssella sp.]|nr:PQQ-dependent sugar dehydrogenase [Candidatus Odyssella sp.]